MKTNHSDVPSATCKRGEKGENVKKGGGRRRCGGNRHRDRFSPTPKHATNRVKSERTIAVEFAVIYDGCIGSMNLK